MNDSMVYLAESVTYCVHPQAPLADIAQAQAYVEALQAKAWFQERWPKVAKKDIRVKKCRTWKWSSGAPWDNVISLSPLHMNNFVVLHEIAHFCSEKEIHQGSDHGPKFCGAYLYLMKRMAGAQVEQSLRHSFRACGVPVERVA